MLRILTLSIALLATPALAAFTEGVDPSDLKRIKERIDAGEAREALSDLLPMLEDPSYEADVLNLMGYAYRKMGDWSYSRRYYVRALAIEPKHKGALEYMGELELQVGDVPAARALLARLQAVCPDGCEELDDLLDAFIEHGAALQN